MSYLFLTKSKTQEEFMKIIHCPFVCASQVSFFFLIVNFTLQILQKALPRGSGHWVQN